LFEFNGLVGEDPHKHLKEFFARLEKRLVVLSTSWEDLKRMLFEKYFLESKVNSIRKEIYGIRQLDKESLYKYYKRFERLCASCPCHQIHEQLLFQYFYEALYLCTGS